MYRGVISVTAILSSITLSLSLASCSSTKAVNQSDAQSSKVESSAEAAKPVETKPVVVEFKQKELPILGSSYQQLDFKQRDAEAVLSNKPRPTTPETLAVFAGNPPPGVDVCNLSYSAVTIAIYEKCINPGLSYIQVSNIFGFKGTSVSESGSIAIYTWGSVEGGLVTATFESDKLTSKSQVKLK